MTRQLSGAHAASAMQKRDFAMNANELMDKAIKNANESAEREKKRTNSYAQSDAEKIRKTSELITGYLEAMITLSWKKDGDKKTRSELASSMSVVENLANDSLDKISKTRDYRKTGVIVKQFYGRVNSVIKKLHFKQLDELAK